MITSSSKFYTQCSIIQQKLRQEVIPQHSAFYITNIKLGHTWMIGSSKADITRSKSDFFPEGGTIILLWVSIISSSTETPSLTAGGGERSTATRGGYRKSFSPRLFNMSKNVFWAASLSTQSVLQREVSLPSKSDIYTTKQKVKCETAYKTTGNTKRGIELNSLCSYKTPRYY